MFGKILAAPSVLLQIYKFCLRISRRKEASNLCFDGQLKKKSEAKSHLLSLPSQLLLEKQVSSFDLKPNNVLARMMIYAAITWCKLLT